MYVYSVPWNIYNLTLYMHIYVDTIIHYPLINVSELPSMTILYQSTKYSSTDIYGVFKHVIKYPNYNLLIIHL